MKLAQIPENLLHFFIPRTSNNHRAKLLHSQVIIFVTILYLFFEVFLYVPGKANLRVLGYAANIPTSEVVKLTNGERRTQGLGELTENPALSQAALAKGTDMLNKGYWAHVSPDGIEPWFFFTNVGYDYRYAGENLARDFSNPKDAMEAWMASPTHRENVLSPKYKEIGVAVVEGDMNGVDTTIIVQLFGTRTNEVAPSIPVASAKEEKKVSETKTGELKTNETLSNTNKENLVSPFKLTKYASAGLISIFIVVMMVDSLIVARRGIIRVGGRAFAHISFLGMILAILLLIKSGQVF